MHLQKQFLNRGGVIGSDSCRVSRLRFIWTQHEKKNQRRRLRRSFSRPLRREIEGFSSLKRILEGFSTVAKMANPHEPYFFKPLLPGFHSGVKTWKLRSDASDQTWEVIQEGRTLTGGWKDFTTAHDLKIGDLVIFKLEGDMVFHVTSFGSSCCELQYTHPHIIKEEADAGDADDNEIRKFQSKFIVLVLPVVRCFDVEIVSFISGGTWAMSSFSFDYCFLAEVTASNLKADKLMILVNKEGNSWTASLRFSEAGGMYYITRGWEKFCRDNRCDIGDLFVFNLVGDGKITPLLCVCPESKECFELLSKHLSRKRGDIASSSRVN
ncbi:hypothetical protein BRARA_F02435 [Brassica rapa]|uniref:TF-B3 domain-containing protein n=1 Tax=Brassica campestris TaxID=3711 RepID=A0A397Z152_BRACM|nr:hypothetical protein BRARA_F02435 [Brassica rapa]